MADEAARREWLLRVLDHDVGDRIVQDRSAQPTTVRNIVISPVKFGKAALLWRGMWAKADRQLQTLRDAVIAAMLDDEDVDPDEYGTIRQNIDDVAALTARLNLSLADQIDELVGAVPEKIEAPLVRLHKRVDQYMSYLETDEMVGLLADNEFHPVSVKTDLLTALRTIKEAVTLN